MSDKPNRDREGTPNPRRARQEAGNTTDTPGVCPPTSPLAYLITFTTYGTWLHGDARGSVDPAHNVPETPFLDPDPQRTTLDRQYHKHAPVRLNSTRRKIVHRTINEVVRHRGWTLHAVNVRTNHVHLVVSADAIPERVMNTMKSWATRRLREAGALQAQTKAWTRHGSTRYLWKTDQIAAACQYVCEGQGVDLQM